MRGKRNPKSEVRRPAALTLTLSQGERGPAKTQNPRPNPPRRGVLLLVVLALLAMFGLVAVAFVVLTGQAQRSAKSIDAGSKGPIDRRLGRGPNLLQQAAMQVFRGATITASVMGAHGLLEGIYGNSKRLPAGTISSAHSTAGGQFEPIV